MFYFHDSKYVQCIASSRTLTYKGGTQKQLYEGTLGIESVLNTNLRRAQKSRSWRTDPDLFHDDGEYIQSGFANVSPAWYMLGRNVRVVIAFCNTSTNNETA